MIMEPRRRWRFQGVLANELRLPSYATRRCPYFHILLIWMTLYSIYGHLSLPSDLSEILLMDVDIEQLGSAGSVPFKVLGLRPQVTLAFRWRHDEILARGYGRLVQMLWDFEIHGLRRGLLLVVLGL